MAITLIKNGFVLDPELPLKQADILIENDLIRQVGSNFNCLADTVINASGKIVLPGLINSHAHAASALFRGLTDNLPLDPWLLYHMHAGMGKLNDRELYLATTIGVIELLKTGTTSIIEHAHVAGSLIGVEGRVDAIVKSIMDTGIRAVIAPSYADIKYSECIPLNLLGKPSPELLAILDPFPPPAADDILQVLHHIIEQWQNRDSRIDLFLGPSNTKSCSRYLMESTVELASKFGLGIHCHLLETKSERIFSPSVVDYLESIHCLGSHVSFAH
jgi:cytosine/adenosine deaminase-related metal-dependent hydrolase